MPLLSEYFANQALCTEYIVKHGKNLKPQVYGVSKEIDDEVARLKLESMEIIIDRLIEELKKYMTSWEEGT